MRRFIKNISVFVTIYLIIYFISFFISKDIDYFINYSSSVEKKVAIIGHSHSEVGVNDSLLTYLTNIECHNYSRSAQSMFWTVIGGRKLIKQGYKYILIELTNSSYNTNWKTTDKARSTQYYERKYFIDYNEWPILFSKNPVFTSSMFFKYTFPSRRLTGRFVKHEKEFNNQMVKENINNIFLPDFNDKILHDFIKNNKNVLFIVFRAPQHPLYYKNINIENEEYFNKKFKAFSVYPNCINIDFGKKFENDSLFADLGHLNYRGANCFTKILADSLNNILQ